MRKKGRDKLKLNNPKKLTAVHVDVTEGQEPDEKMQPILADNGQYDQLVQSLGLVHSASLKATRALYNKFWMKKIQKMLAWLKQMVVNWNFCTGCSG